MRPGSAQVRIGSAKRRDLAGTERDVPGPGNYEIPSKMVEGPRVKMLGHKYDAVQKQKDYVPGPGTYSATDIPKTRPQSAK